MLTPREFRISKFVTAGWKNKEIAKVLGITESTVKNSICHIYNKLGFNNRVELALWFIRNIEFSKRFSPAPVTGVFHGNEDNQVENSRELGGK